MYKNQLQELAQRSCFNLPSYACIREGPDHAPRFRASVNFHGEIFEGPSYCPTLRQAEHAAAEVALNNLSTRGGTSRSLAARVLDETGVYKNLLQETAHRAGLKLPVYTTVRSGPGHQPVFTCSVELAGMSFSGEPAKTKKQAEKNAAMAAWSALKQMPNLDSLKEVASGGEEQEQVIVAKVLSNFKPKEENRQRDQQRRRMASPHSSLLFRNQWRSNDPFSDHSSIYHQSSKQQNQRGFLALPHPNGPKILPPLPYLNHSSTNTTIQEPSSSFAKNNNTPCLLPSTRPIPSLEECQKDDDDWTNATSRSKEKSVVRDPYLSKPTQAYGPTMPLPYQRTRPFSPPPHAGPSMRSPMLNLIPRTIGSGGFHGIAPAVHVRSVIPVCAVPPQPMRPPQNNPVTQKKETEEEASAATSKLNGLQL